MAARRLFGTGQTLLQSRPVSFVGADVDRLELLQAGHSDGWGSVQVEHEESRRDRQERALVVGGKAIGDSTHGVFSDSVLNVSAGVVAAQATLRGQRGVHEIFHPWPLQIDRHRQVCATGNHRLAVLPQGSHKLSGSGPCRSVAGEFLLRQERLPVLWQLASHPRQKLLALLRVRLDVLGHETLPFGHQLVALGRLLLEEVVHVLRNVELLGRVHAVLDFELAHTVLAQSVTVRSTVVLERSTRSNHSSAVDKCWSVLLGLRVLQGLDNGSHVLGSVLDLDHVPVAGLELGTDVLRVGNVNTAVTADLVVVVEHNQIVQPHVAGQRDRLESRALLQARIANHAVHLVGDDIKARLVVRGSQVFGGYGQTNRVRDTLAERARCDLDGVVLDFWVTGTQRVEVIRVVGLQLRHGHRLETVQVLEDILEQTHVTVRQDKPVSVEVVRVVGSIFQGVFPQSNSDSHGAHGRARVASSVLLDNVQDKSTTTDGGLFIGLLVPKHPMVADVLLSGP
ncbi:hypothetical protein OGATHE_003157 [Ogataea polymorpha]|uniref:Uncharacterized protein n=1 Tax=Ogataea polymorpha TaxID=460523 RepID=A0A9P8PAD1_9ASCO|nr:hypothetical protein OGATHE_003157 [Ogataea polymorpha]